MATAITFVLSCKVAQELGKLEQITPYTASSMIEIALKDLFVWELSAEEAKARKTIKVQVSREDSNDKA